jgi:hypothetical protein
VIRRGVTITVLARSAGYDTNGDPLPPTGAAHTIEQCGVAPRTAGGQAVNAGETVDRGRAGVVIGITAYLPAGADLLRSDQVTIDDPAFPGIWDVEGMPGSWRSPLTGRHAGVEVALRRAEG